MKLYSCDEKMFSLGSFNNDLWSWGINNELNAVIENDPVETAKLLNMIKQKVLKKSLLVPIKQISAKNWLKMQYLYSVTELMSWLMAKKGSFRQKLFKNKKKK